MPQPSRLSIEWASRPDEHWLIQHDPHASGKTIREKIARREVLVARQGGRIVGWLRFGLFWDTIPFIVLLFVLEDRRGHHIGSRLVGHFERKIRALRFNRIMVSSRSDKHAQHFWRKLGYKDIGGFALPREPFEILFVKEL